MDTRHKILSILLIFLFTTLSVHGQNSNETSLIWEKAQRFLLNEEKFLSEKYKDKYLDYKKNTSRYFISFRYAFKSKAGK